MSFRRRRTARRSTSRAPISGAPYQWGGLTEAGIDCSGLVHMAYRRLGRLVPRDAAQQEGAADEVAELEPGDLITYGEPADHIAFWLGDGRILHATGRADVIVCHRGARAGRPARAAPPADSALRGAAGGSQVTPLGGVRPNAGPENGR